MERVTIGRILKPFGIKGDVRVQSLSDVPGRFEALREVTVAASSGREIVTRVTHVRQDRDSYVLGVEAWSTPEEAAAFRGALIQIPEEQVPGLPSGQYYEFQLLGMVVVDDSGERLGMLEQILETAGNPVFTVRGSGREWMVPGIQDVVTSIDLQSRTMVVRRAGIVPQHHEL